MSAAYTTAAIIVGLSFFVASASEFGRGMMTTPSMYRSYFFPLLISGLVIAVLVAISHHLFNW